MDWAADSYDRPASFLYTITGWPADLDEPIAARTAELLTWFATHDHHGVRELSDVRIKN